MLRLRIGVSPTSGVPIHFSNTQSHWAIDDILPGSTLFAGWPDVSLLSGEIKMIGRLAGFVPLLVFVFPAMVHAQDFQQRTLALREIQRTALILCPPVETTQRTTQAEAKAQVDAVIPGLFRKLLNLNAGASAAVKDESSRGVLQRHLASLIVSTNQCRLEVLKTLQATMLGPPIAIVSPGKPIAAPPAAMSPPPAPKSGAAPSSAPNGRKNPAGAKPSAAAAPGRMRTVAKTGPTLRLYFKNNLTAIDMAQLAGLLPTFTVVPGAHTMVNRSASADALFVNRDKVSRDEVLKVLEAFEAIGVPIRSVLQTPVGGRREIQAGTVVVYATDNPQDQEQALTGQPYLSAKRLRGLGELEFWRAAWNDVGMCLADGQLLNCALDANARPHPVMAPSS
jgi:hypothetical protein